jgi:hypothetical protein
VGAHVSLYFVDGMRIVGTEGADVHVLVHRHRPPSPDSVLTTHQRLKIIQGN